MTHVTTDDLRVVFHCQTERWESSPSNFVRLPQIGEYVESPSGANLQVTEIKHIRQGMWIRVA